MHVAKRVFVIREMRLIEVLEIEPLLIGSASLSVPVADHGAPGRLYLPSLPDFYFSRLTALISLPAHSLVPVSGRSGAWLRYLLHNFIFVHIIFVHNKI